MFVLDSIKKFTKTDKTALINSDMSLSYAELDCLSDAFAAWLLQRFGDDRSPIIIYGHKETLILPCIYGALKSGRAYVPVDITVPADRARSIAEDVKPKVCVDFYGVGMPSEVTLDEQSLSQTLKEYKNIAVSPDNWVKGQDYAYILFTSGSTGKPKGVPITVANIENLYNELDPWMAADGDIILNQISYSFDVSVCSIYMGVARGMTLYTIDKAMVEELGSLFEFLGKSGVAIWVSTPSFAEMCVPSGRFSAELLPKIEKFLFCGEVLTHKLVAELFSRFPQAKVINTYGPTEATVLVTAVEINEKMAADSLQIPIGYPLPEVTFRIVDERGHELNSGEQGELLIISKNVGPGYFRRPDLTEKVFFEDGKTGKRGYHTGDACFEKNGLYYYCGRLDNQIKLNGFRVEIEDIENNLVKAPNVARAAVLPIDDGEKVQYLVAFVLLEKPDGMTNFKRAVEIKKALRDVLPGYMIPRKITTLDSFPLNTNGKVDKKVLRAMLMGDAK